MRVKLILVLITVLLLVVGCTAGATLEPQAAEQGGPEAANAANAVNEGGLTAETGAVAVPDTGADVSSDATPPSIEERQAAVDAANKSGPPLTDSGEPIVGPEPGTQTGTDSGSVPGQPGDTVTFVVVELTTGGVSNAGMVELQNSSGEAVQLEGWQLRDELGTIIFEFPEYLLKPGETCQLYTGEARGGEPAPGQQVCSFNINPSASTVWAKNDGCLLLYDGTRVVQTFCLPQ